MGDHCRNGKGPLDGARLFMAAGITRILRMRDVWSLATATEVAGACHSAAIKRCLMFKKSTNYTNVHGLWGRRGRQEGERAGELRSQ